MNLAQPNNTVLTDKWNDKGINIHHNRVYKINNVLYCIDKTMNGIGGFYTVRVINVDGSFGYELDVAGESYWGAGWSWNKAVTHLRDFVMEKDNG